MIERGKIRDKLCASQIRDFSGLLFANSITPTDIDGLIEYKNKLFIFIELKYNGMALPAGQQLALERLVDALQATHKSILLVAMHNTPADQSIEVSSCPVVLYYYKKFWRSPKQSITLRQAIDTLLGSILDSSF